MLDEQTRILLLEREAARQGKTRADNLRQPLRRFIPWASRGRLSDPYPLAPLCDFFDRLASGARSLFLTLHAPPRHGKSATIAYGIARLLLLDPTLRIGYVSYNATVAEGASVLAAAAYRAAGGRFARETAESYETAEGGYLKSAGIGGSWTSFGFDLIVFDDPYHDRADAESAAYKRRVHDFFTSVLFTRLEARGGEVGSVLVQHTRWSEDDLIGEICAGRFEEDIPPGWPHLPWEHVCLRAINDDGSDPLRPVGAPLWPERYPLQALRLKMGPDKLMAESIYQGRPRGRDAVLFALDPPRYSVLPAIGRRAIGLDFAYTVKTSSDWSAAVAGLREVRRHKGQDLPFYYVTHVVRVRCRADDFGDEVAALRGRVGTCRCGGYVYGPEKGNLDNIRRISRVHVECLEKPGDKYVRAQEYAASWNDERVLLPADGAHVPGPCTCDRSRGECPSRVDASWVGEFLDEHRRFNGRGTGFDDQVDAAVAMHDMLRAGVQLGHSGRGRVDGRPTGSDRDFDGGGF